MAFTAVADMETAPLNSKFHRTASGARMASPVDGEVALPSDDDGQELPIGTKIKVTDTAVPVLEVSVPLEDASVVVTTATTVAEIVGDLTTFRDAYKVEA